MIKILVMVAMLVSSVAFADVPPTKVSHSDKQTAEHLDRAVSAQRDARHRDFDRDLKHEVKVTSHKTATR
jgi:hypothetical protein